MKDTKNLCFFSYIIQKFIKHSKVFSINGCPQKGWFSLDGGI